MKTACSLVAAALLPLVVFAEDTKPTPVGKKIAEFTLRDYRGPERSLKEFTTGKLTVVAFLGCDCPLAKVYGPRLAALAKEYEGKGVAFVGVNSNQQDTPSAVGQYAKTHGISFPILKDPGNVVADRFGAERTPEVFVLDGERVVRYTGSIDDQFGIGYSRPKAEHRYLVAALDELLAGKAVTTSRMESEGCFIGRFRKPAATGSVTYSKQIARIFQRHCVDCHHAGAIGPFPLTTYDECVGFADTIRWAVKNDRMPPWHADKRYGKFANECRLSDDDKEHIMQWVKEGTPEGDKKDLPPPATFVEGWRIPKPDVVLTMPKPFAVQAEGDIVYQFFAIPTGFTEDKWVKAAEVRAGSRAVVHHILVFVQPPEDKRPFRGFINDWLVSTVPGARPMILPDGMAKRIPAGSRLLLQIHYTPNGSAQLDQSSVGLVFADPNSVKKEVRTDMAVDNKFVIPPGDNNHRVDAEKTLEADTLLLTLMPHTHLRGKAFKFEAIYPNGEREVVLDVPRYDFNWQNTYVLAEPKRLPAGTKLHCTAYYDNSTKNKSNPDPKATVRWGDQTWQEMMIGYFESTPAEQDVKTVASAAPSPAPSEPPAFDPKLKELAGKALDSQQAWDAFAAAVRTEVPQIDRVCLTYFIGASLRVERSAYPGKVQSRFAETGYEGPAFGFGMVVPALRGLVTVVPDLRLARGADYQVMSKTLGSAMHIPVIRDDARPGSINFWSKDKDSFDAKTQAKLVAIAKALPVK
jgi:thiol-disulfide isomerase/thioredoxin